MGPKLEALRTQPYRLLFPLGVLLSWLGVGQWLLFSLRLSGVFRVPFHAMVQVQGFIGCFVAGFLLTFIPRRTRSEPPRWWQLSVCALSPVLLTVFAWLERWALAQSFWLLELGVLMHFVWGRARRNRNPAPPPPTLAWIPVALGMGVVGAVLAAFPQWHGVGKSMVLEGVVSALVMGIGSMLIPVIAHGAPPPDASGAAGARWPQLLLGMVFATSFVLEPGRWAYALRLSTVILVLVVNGQLWRLPTRTEVHRWLVWGAAWLLPVGYAVVTLWPSLRTAGLHIIFVGSFSLLALSVGHHVVTAHAGAPGERIPMLGVGLLLAVALTARLLMTFDDSARYAVWMSAAAIAFIAAGVAWLAGATRWVLGSARVDA